MPHCQREYAVREHLALISTEVYLLLRSKDEDERIQRYYRVQEVIDVILALTKSQPDKPAEHNPQTGSSL